MKAKTSADILNLKVSQASVLTVRFPPHHFVSKGTLTFTDFLTPPEIPFLPPEARKEDSKILKMSVFCITS